MAKNIDVEDLLRRVEALERAVLGGGTPKSKTTARPNAGNFDGATGGVRFIFSKASSTAVRFSRRFKRSSRTTATITANRRSKTR